METSLHLGMYAEERFLLVEKFKRHDYIDGLGCKIWLDKYGELIKVEDRKGKSVSIARYGDGTIGKGLLITDLISSSSKKAYKLISPLFLQT